MGVSTGGQDLDLNAVVAGGAEFLQRVATIKAEKDAAEQALNNLNLGISAVEANKKAQAILAEATAKRDADMAALSAELKDARDSLSKWSDQVREEAASLRQEASDANEKAKTCEAAAVADRAQARKELNDAGSSSDQIISDARAEAQKIVKDAQDSAIKLTKDASDLKAGLSQALADAKAAEAKFKAKLQILNNATSAALTE